MQAAIRIVFEKELIVIYLTSERSIEYRSSRAVTDEIDDSKMTKEEVVQFIANKKAEGFLAVQLDSFPYDSELDRSTQRDFCNYSIYPDNIIRTSAWIYFEYDLKIQPEVIAEEIDHSPLAVSDALTLDIKHSYEVWAALFDHYAEMQFSPHYRFDKIIMSATRKDNGKNVNYEVTHPEQLASIIRLRRARHNAAINARRIVEPIYKPLVAGLEKAYNAAPPLSIDYQPFIKAQKALDDFDVNAKIKHYAELDRQVPTRSNTLAIRKKQYKADLRREAARCMHDYSGSDLHWLTAARMHAQGYDINRLIQTLDESCLEIDAATTLFEVDLAFKIAQVTVRDCKIAIGHDLTLSSKTISGADRLRWHLFAHVKHAGYIKLTLDATPALVFPPQIKPASTHTFESAGAALFQIEITKTRLPHTIEVIATVELLASSQATKPLNTKRETLHVRGNVVSIGS